MSQTIVICKPDVFDHIKRNPEYDALIKDLPEAEVFVDYVKSYLVSKGLTISQEKREVMSIDIAAKHYDWHKNNPERFEFLKKMMSSWISHVMLVEWENAQPIARQAIMDLRIEFLKTPKQARHNMMHASGNIEEAEYEVLLHFPN